MNRARHDLFARRGIAVRTTGKVLLVVAIAFAIGVGAGWFTTLVPGLYYELTAPAASPTPSATPSPIPSLSVEPSAQPEITRELDADDAAAGIVSLTVPFRGEETFTAIGGTEESTGTALATRWIRIEVEDGLDVNVYRLSEFVMGTLNDNRGWGTGDSIEFLRTDGVPDARIVIASERTAAALCSDPESGLAAGPVVEATSSASTTASSDDGDGTVTPLDTAGTSCVASGIMIISLYDWTAGYEVYGDDRQDSRRYLLNHFAGYLLGHTRERCPDGSVADIMVRQTDMRDSCTVNPWPYPDADPSPSPSVSATAAS